MGDTTLPPLVTEGPWTLWWAQPKLDKTNPTLELPHTHPCLPRGTCSVLCLIKTHYNCVTEDKLLLERISFLLAM